MTRMLSPSEAGCWTRTRPPLRCRPGWTPAFNQGATKGVLKRSPKSRIRTLSRTIQASEVRIHNEENKVYSGLLLLNSDFYSEYKVTILKEFDTEIAKAIQGELDRQEYKLEMIASENFVSKAVLEAAGCVMTNKYAEGYPGRRYY